MIEELYTAALKLEKIYTTNNFNHIIALGRTPTFLVEALKILNPSLGEKIIQISASGHPDRLLCEKNSQTGDRGDNLSNMVTTSRLEVYFQYLHDMRVHTLSGNVAILDMVGSGFGLNSYLDVLRGYFSACELEAPQFSFIGMNLSDAPLYSWDITAEELEKYRKNKETFESLLKICKESDKKIFLYDGGEKGTLKFYPDIKEKGIKDEEIPAYALYMPNDVVGLLDKSFFAEKFAKGISYWADDWRKVEEGGKDPRKSAPFYEVGVEILKKLLQKVQNSTINSESKMTPEDFKSYFSPEEFGEILKNVEMHNKNN